MAFDFTGAHIISGSQVDREGLTSLFYWAERMKKIVRRDTRCQLLHGYILGNYFFEGSTRTRLSSHTAFARLGGEVETITDIATSSMGKKKETIQDSIRVMQHYCDLMVIRHWQEGIAAEAAQLSRVPIINGGDGPKEHPTQGYTDGFTMMQEFNRIDGLTVALIGDLKYSRPVHSLVTMLTMFDDVRFIFIAPEASQVPTDQYNEVKRKGFQVEKTEDFIDGISRADVIYMVRPQIERTDNVAEQTAMTNMYCLTADLISKHCKKNMRVLHPLPRNEELDTSVDGLPNAAYFRQVENGVCVRAALFLLLLGKTHKFV